MRPFSRLPCSHFIFLLFVRHFTSYHCDFNADYRSRKSIRGRDASDLPALDESFVVGVFNLTDDTPMEAPPSPLFSSLYSSLLHLRVYLHVC